MIKEGFNSFSGKKILLLQGPVGPFLKRLAKALNEVDALVIKINLNGGDFFFYPNADYNFRGQFKDWENFLSKVIEEHHIETIFLFGQSRKYHEVAINLASQFKIELGIFEEGYVRPHYVTLEKKGVNHKSSLPNDPDFYLDSPNQKPLTQRAVKHSFGATIWRASLYYLFGSLLKPFFKYYQHHRRLSVLEAWPWIKAFYRKWIYYYLEQEIFKRLKGPLAKSYFLVPLQVHNDAQIKDFKKLDDIEHFIQNTIQSFAKFASKDHHLVFKHHPLDRGYTDYKILISQLSRQYEVGGRVHYIHDLHLPTLFKHTRGVIVVNSTAGLQALYHNIPTKVIGETVFNIKGLTYQKPLHQFWKEAHKHKPNTKLYQKFINYLIQYTQLNGSFYKSLRSKDARAGLIWGG
jgi:capsular polysaccharide export protein